MIALLEDAARAAGALGMSSGLFTRAGLLRRARTRWWRSAPGAQDATTAPTSLHLRDEIEQGAGRGRRRRSTLAEACGVHVEIVHFKCSGDRQLGQERRALDDDRRRQGARARRRLRLLPYAAGSQSAQEPDAAMGAGGRRRPPR